MVVICVKCNNPIKFGIRKRAEQQMGGCFGDTYYCKGKKKS